MPQRGSKPDGKTGEAAAAEHSGGPVKKATAPAQTTVARLLRPRLAILARRSDSPIPEDVLSIRKPAPGCKCVFDPPRGHPLIAEAAAAANGRGGGCRRAFAASKWPVVSWESASRPASAS